MTDVIDLLPVPTSGAPAFADEFAALQTALEPGIRRFVRRLLGDYGDPLAVDDLTQDTFIALYRKLSAANAPLDLALAQPYTYGIARNLVYAEMRRSRRYGLALADDHDQVGGYSDSAGGYAVIADSADSPEEAAHWLLLSLAVRAAIDRLPDAQRQAMILYSEEEMSYEQIAQIMGVSVGTVASRVHYARRTLRAMLDPDTLTSITESQ
ncbi:MAG: sigma-70 family RNA polymerase sigma factor [Chloroflexota bacterium]|nr:sigma-70 family RNA polymerase sigma factor [Chloroflexota bacterium]